MDYTVNLEEWKTYFMDAITGLMPMAIKAVLIYVVGRFLIKRLMRLVKLLFHKKDWDPTLEKFAESFIHAALNVILVVLLITTLGVQTSSLVAILGAASLAIGLALQGSLSNLAGGVLILLLKPFKVGDTVLTKGITGTVLEVQLFYTIVKTPSGQRVTIPNGQVTNDVITNYNIFENRRMDFTFGIGYTDDIDKAKAVLKEIIDNEPRFLKDPAPALFVESLADSSVNIRFRAWTVLGDFWDVHNDINERVKKAFDANGISIPFPQRDVHLYPTQP